MGKATLDWIKRLIAKDPTASVKRTAFLLVVVAGISWLSVDLSRQKSGITSEWNNSFFTLCGLVGLSYVGGVAMERMNAKTEGDKP